LLIKIIQQTEYYSSPAEVGLASHSSKSGVEARVPPTCSSRWLDKHRRIWLPTFSLPPTLATLSFGLPLRGYASFHAHITTSVIEVSLLPVLVCETPCHHICGRMWTIRTFQASAEDTKCRL